MRVLTTERWEYHEYVHYEIEAFPEGWDDWGMEEQHQWVVENGEFINLESEPCQMLEIEDVEAR